MQQVTASEQERVSARAAWADVADLMPDGAFVFDARSRVLGVNRALRESNEGAAGAAEARSVGEWLACRHADPETGCGAAEACAVCGWRLAAEAAAAGDTVERECRIETRDGGARDLLLRVRPGAVRGGGLCVAADRYAQKRLRVLERTFFHDVTNHAVGIRGLCDMLDLGDPAQLAETVPLVHESAIKMTDDILRLRTLRVAENGDLEPCYSCLASADLVKELFARYADEAACRHVTLADESDAFPFESDADLLRLVLGALLLNAVEASGRGDRVTVRAWSEAGLACFQIRNPAVLATAERLQVFQRSYTTKGAGKGVGAYAAKLIAERVLHGVVRLESRVPDGTVCEVRLAACRPAAD